MPTYELEQGDMSRRRTPSELHQWVEDRCEELASSPEAKAYARQGSKLVKKLFDEIRPLALFAFKAFGNASGTWVIPNLNNDNFDGTVEFADGRQLFVEITYAKDGHDDSLRMEVLAKEGHVNALAPISYVGTRGSPSRSVSVPNEAVDHDEIVKKHLEYVARCLKLKSNVVYGRNHVLVVVVDDYIPFRTAKDVVMLESFVHKNIPQFALNFRRVFFLGASGNLLVEYSSDKSKVSDVL